METKEEKIDFLNGSQRARIVFEEDRASKKAIWINKSSNNYDDLIAMTSDETKSTKIKSQDQAIFKTFGNGVNTARDSWVIDSNSNQFTLDSETQVTGVPEAAWSYRLGNRSALEWILDQHKEKTPKDPTIREKFNTYRFADYKEKVVDLLMRVTRVSVETVEIVEAMRATKR